LEQFGKRLAHVESGPANARSDVDNILEECRLALADLRTERAEWARKYPDLVRDASTKS